EHRAGCSSRPPTEMRSRPRSAAEASTSSASAAPERAHKDALASRAASANMSIDERARHRLFLRLEEILGPEEAGVLMEHLPPVGWGDVGTKQDIALLEARMEAMKHEILGTMRQEMARNTATFVRTTVLGNAAAILAVAGIAFG